MTIKYRFGYPTEEEDMYELYVSSFFYLGGEAMEQKEIPIKEYLAFKQKLFEESEHPDGLTWDQIKHQIIGAYYLNLPQEDINLFADAKHTFKQMEIIKFAMFAGIAGDSLSELLLPDQDIPKMLTAFQEHSDAKTRKAMDIVENALKTCQEDMTYFKQHVTASMQQDKEKIDALVAENAELKKLTMKQAEEIDELNRQISISADKKSADLKKQEQQKAYDAHVEALAKKRYEERILEFEIEKRKEEEMRERIRQEMLASGEVIHKSSQPNRGIFSRFKKKEKEAVAVPKSFEKQPLPPNFDLAEYILNAKLTASQLQIITICVKAELDDSIIKQLIDSRVPADQMKSIVEIILTREDKEKKPEPSTVRDEEYYGSYDEMMYGGEAYDQQ